MKRHGRDNYYVLGEGILTSDVRNGPAGLRPSTEAELRKFRFSINWAIDPEGGQNHGAHR